MLCLLTPLSVQAQSISTKLIAPSPIEHDLDLVRPINENSAIAVGNGNTIVRTDDRGLSWREITTRPFMTGIKELQVITPTRWLGVTGLGYVFLTTDGGENFTSSRPGYGFDGIYDQGSISFIDSLNGIIRFINDSEKEYFHSTQDGGLNWTRIRVPSVDYCLQAIMFPGNIILQATTHEVLRSTNTGTTWTNVFPMKVSGFLKFNDSIAFISTAADSILRTTDKGITWQTTGMVPPNVKPLGMMRLADGTVFHFQPSLGVLSISTDTCKSFNEIQYLPGTGNSMRFYRSYVMFSRYHGIAVGDRGTVTALDGPRLELTQVSRNHLYARETFWVDTIFSISGQGEFTTDGGKKWNVASFPHEVGRTCLPVAGKSGYAVIGQNRMVVSWPPPVDDRYLDIAASTDSGKTWQGRRSDVRFQGLDVSALNDSLFVVLGRRANNFLVKFYFFSFNNKSLQITERTSTMDFYKVTAYPSKNALLATAGNIVYISQDTGKVWYPFANLPSSANLASGDIFVTENRIILIVNQNFCLESSDNGVTWHQRNDTSPVMAQYSGPYAASPDGLIAYRVDDKLVLWHPDGTKRILHQFLYRTYITSVQFVGKNTIFVSTNQQAVLKFTLDSALTSAKAEQLLTPEKANLVQNYPNPFNPVTKVTFDLANSGLTKGVVYDILGREVTTLVNEELPAGQHQLDFNAMDLPSGIYFFRLTTKGYSGTIKMMLVR
ncbi:MAG: T9SS type A sorting domain-containing protein [Ignavibacteriales bacterium]|nr:T9SS type A sorting domain-containing protein [Ignavibacteriales bacterium]